MNNKITLQQWEFYDVRLRDGLKLGTIQRYTTNGKWSILAQDKIGNIYLLENQPTQDKAIEELLHFHDIK